MSSWDTLIEPLTDAYLLWRYPLDSRSEDGVHVRQEVQDPSSMYMDSDDVLVPYTVQTYDLWSIKETVTIMRKHSSESAAVDFMAHGYLVKSPTRPTVAVSMRTLELLYRLRQRKASFSIEAFAKVICDYYQVGYLCHMLYEAHVLSGPLPALHAGDHRRHLRAVPTNHPHCRQSYQRVFGLEWA